MSNTLVVGDLEYSIDQHLLGVVEKIDRDSLRLRLPGEVRGVIDRADLPIEFHQGQLRHHISRGAQVETRITGHDERRNILELTFLRVISDPWVEALPKLSRALPVRGVVHGIAPFGAFVDLQMGLSALVHVSEIPGAAFGHVDECLKVGDLVEGLIVKIDREKRQIGLSISKHVAILRKHRKDARSQQDAVEFRRSVAVDRQAQERPQLERGLGRIRRILLVDNDSNFTRELRHWLEKRHYEVETAEGGQVGVELATEQSFDLIFMDYVLADMKGTEAAGRIQQQRPHARIAILTGQLTPPPGPELEDLRLVGVVSKYKGIPGIEAMIACIEQQAEEVSWSAERDELDQESILIQQSAAATWNRGELSAALAEMLADLRATTGADAAFVFAMELESESISTLAHVGRVANDAYDLQDLRFSPLRDVMYENEQIFQNDVLRHDRKFKYLLRYLLVESCIGIRIASDQPQQRRHALFLFHRQPRRFMRRHFAQALLASKLMALAFERDTMLREQLENRALATGGRVQSGLMHELNNLLSHVEVSIENVQDDFGDLAKNPRETLARPRFLSDMDQSLASAAKAVQNLRAVAETYLGMLRDDSIQRLNVNQVLDDAVEVVRHEAMPEVYVATISNENAPDVVGVRARLERVFVNLLLNGIQQVKTYAAHDTMMVAMVEHVPGDPRFPVKIHVVDPGPGIHRADHERVFEQGYSTRHDGYGLGLPISRGLIEGMGGRLRILDSIMFVGTHLVVELPAAPAVKPRETEDEQSPT